MIGADAATTAVAGLLQVQTSSATSRSTPAHRPEAAASEPRPSPQTLLLIGSDHRAGEPFRCVQHRHDAARAAQRVVLDDQRDVDPARPAGRRSPASGSRRSTPPTPMAATGLLIKTIKQNVFPHLHVNHIVDTNFTGFSDLVDAIGCVYSDVDRRYYNDSNAAPERTTRASTSSPATRSCAATTSRSAGRCRSSASATPTPTSCARRASRTSSAGPRSSSRLKCCARPRQAAADLRQALDARQEPAVDRWAPQPVQPRAQRRRPARSIRCPFPADLQPCTATSCFVTAQPVAEQAAFARFMTATPKAADRGQTRPSRPRRRSRATSTWPRSPPPA